MTKLITALILFAGVMARAADVVSSTEGSRLQSSVLLHSDVKKGNGGPYTEVVNGLEENPVVSFSVTFDANSGKVAEVSRPIEDGAIPASEWTAVVQPETIIGYFVVSNVESGAFVEAQGSKLAAFAANGECRGVAGIIDGPNGKLFSISIGIESSTESGLTLKCWDAATGTMNSVNEYVIDAAVVGEQIGRIVAPQLVRVGEKPAVKPEAHTVTFALGEHGAYTGGGALTQTVEDGTAAAAPTFTVADGWEFDGWSTSFDCVTADMTVTARYKEMPSIDPEPARPSIVGKLETVVATTFPATTYDGYLLVDSVEASRHVYGEEGAVAGTVQVKAAKAKYSTKTGKTTTKLTIGIQLAGEKKKISFSAEYDLGKGGEQEFHAKDGRTLKLLLGANGLTGSFSGVALEAVANVFTMKDLQSKALASAADAAYVGTYNVFAEEGALSVSVSTKGKAKVAGTLADGTKVSASAQLLVGDDVACAPFVLPKHGLAFAVWFGEKTTVVGLTDAIAGAATDIVGQNAFYADVEALSDVLYTTGIKPLPEFLPYALSVTSNGKKWMVSHGDKAGKIKYDAASGQAYDASSAYTENHAGLSLSYSAKAGTFTGSFKVYGVAGGKLKTYTAKVAGVLVDGQGYGYATIAKVGSANIRIFAESLTVPWHQSQD